MPAISIIRRNSTDSRFLALGKRRLLCKWKRKPDTIMSLRSSLSVFRKIWKTICHPLVNVFCAVSSYFLACGAEGGYVWNFCCRYKHPSIYLTNWLSFHSGREFDTEKQHKQLNIISHLPLELLVPTEKMIY